MPRCTSSPLSREEQSASTTSVHRCGGQYQAFGQGAGAAKDEENGYCRGFSLADASLAGCPAAQIGCDRDGEVAGDHCGLPSPFAFFNKVIEIKRGGVHNPLTGGGSSDKE